MKSFNRMIAAVAVIAAVIFAAVNLWLSSAQQTEGRQYRVDASRAAVQIENGGIESLNMKNYPALRAVVPVESEEDLAGAKYDYLIKEIGGKYYRFDYETQSGIGRDVLIALNVALGVMAALALAVLLYVRARIMKPFFTLRKMPEELARGNLTMPLKENRQRYFGRFVWGMDMLREQLEHSRRTELALQAERKKLILSLSHDIKIPLSAIRLYSKTLSKGLCSSEAEQVEIAEKIDRKADEISRYVSEIATASREEFLSLEVKEGEFYLAELIDKVSIYYREKLRTHGTEFTLEPYGNCLIRGDFDRAVEVMQNIMENAIKYGDGKHISISVTEEEGCRLVAVSNTGCTLPQSEMPHMFDSFWRGSNASGETGSGLGLYIARCLINKMGGEVFAQAHDGVMSVTAVFCPA